MKRITTLVVATVIALGGSIAVAQEMEKFVRYSMNGGEVHWGMIHGDTVWQLAGAPYETMEHTGLTHPQDSVKLEAPVDPTLVFMTAFNFRSHITGEPAEYPGPVSYTHLRAHET